MHMHAWNLKLLRCHVPEDFSLVISVMFILLYLLSSYLRYKEYVFNSQFWYNQLYFILTLLAIYFLKHSSTVSLIVHVDATQLM
jgi:hypothetical protein